MGFAGKEELRAALTAGGACAVGFAKADIVDDNAIEAFGHWLSTGRHAGMAYMADHKMLRRDPRSLLDGAKTVITLAYPYSAELANAHTGGHISAYAFYPDYHKRIRKIIRKSLEGIPFGEDKDWRVCVDSAPIMERYWAVRSGLGIIGDNGLVIVPEAGSRVFLAEILTTHEYEPDAPADDPRGCGHCGRCRDACPTGALQNDCTIDCDLCLSYLTIEHRGEWESSLHRRVMSTRAGRDTLFGCDRCVEACPHNSHISVRSPFSPKPEVGKITARLIAESDDDTLSKLTEGTPLRRAGLDGLRRNAKNVLCIESPEENADKS